MDARELLYRLMYQALVEMREEGHTIQNKKVFYLADLVHTLPLQLEQKSQDDDSYDDILRMVQVRAEDKGLQQWLDQVISEQSNL